MGPLLFVLEGCYSHRLLILAFNIRPTTLGFVCATFADYIVHVLSMGSSDLLLDLLLESLVSAPTPSYLSALISYGPFVSS